MSNATMIAAIEAALAVGATSVTDENGRTINYGSRADMLDAIARLEARQDSSNGTRRVAFTQVKPGGTR